MKFKIKPQVISGRFCQLILLAIIVWAFWDTAQGFWDYRELYILHVLANTAVATLSTLAILAINDLIKGE